MNIYLVRHTTYSNPENIYAFHLPMYLSVEGREHAVKIGEWFKNNTLLHIPIYTSPIIRCVQTAEIIAAQLKSFVAVDTDLIESYCPVLQGKIKPSENAGKMEEDEPSRESKASLFTRIVRSFQDKINKKEDCILVSHGDPLTVLYYHLINKELPRYFWDEEESTKVFRKGEIMHVTLNNSQLSSVKRYIV